MLKISPCIWFNDQAEEAANFYAKVFPNSKILHIEKYSTETPSNKSIGSVMTVTIDIDGNEFMLLNGGDYFKVNEAISFIIECKDQEEINYYYDNLSADPNAEMCGWLKDKYGVSWQLITKDFDKLMESADDDGKKRIMEALMEMRRIDISVLEEAAKLVS